MLDFATSLKLFAFVLSQNSFKLCFFSPYLIVAKLSIKGKEPRKIAR